MAKKKAKTRVSKKGMKDLEVPARKAKGVKGGMSLAGVVVAATSSSTLPSTVKTSEGSTATAIRG